MNRQPVGQRLARAAAAALATALLAVMAAPAALAASGPPVTTRPQVPAPVGGARLGGQGVIVSYPAHGAIRLPRVAASAYLLADAATGQVLAAKDPHGWFRPASTLKVLTAITLMPVLNPAATVVASHRAAAAVPSKVGLIPGDSYPVTDLFKALLMISANDAAVALVQATGSYAHGIAMMNAEAHHLRADDTVAVTPNGLDAVGQRSSAYDEALFARQALAIPEFMQDELLRTVRFPVKPHHKPVTLYSQNTMLGSYPGDLGGKIGWTTKAKATFIGWARRGHTTLVVTILHCTPLTELTSAARLLNWGFAMDGKVKPVGELVSPLPASAPPAAPAPAVAHRRLLARPAASGVAAVPLVAGLAVLVVAALATVVAVLISRHLRRAGDQTAR